MMRLRNRAVFGSPLRGSKHPSGTALSSPSSRQQVKVNALVIIGRPGTEQKSPNDPVGVVRRCLQAMRMKDRPLLRSFFPKDFVPTPMYKCQWPNHEHPDILEGGCFVGLMDVGTRRLAPNNILRRSEVRSVLRLGNSAQLRVVICARNGEEAILNFDLSYEGNASGGAGWNVNSITRDAESDAEIPTGLHPRYSPESVATAQLQALQANDASYASQYILQDRSLSVPFLSDPDPLPSALSSLSVRDFCLGPSCLPNEYNQIQQVEVVTGEGRKEELVLLMALDRNSCWGLAGLSRRARVVPVLGEQTAAVPIDLTA